MTIRLQLLEKAFLQIWLNDSDEKAAIQCSWEAVETHELAESNITKLLKLWNEEQAIGSEILRCCTETFSDKFSFLMCLFFGVKPTDSNRSHYLKIENQFFNLLHVFGPTVAAYCRMRSSTQAGGNNDSLLLQLSRFHKELRSKCQNHVMVSTSGSMQPKMAHSTVEEEDTGSPIGRKPLSKKAARKLKQQQKNAQAATEHSSSMKANSGSNNNKKHNNNKKKRGKR